MSILSGPRAELEQENKRLRERLVNLEAQLGLRDFTQPAILGVGEAVIVTDAGGRITFLNGSASALTGLGPPEGLGCPVQDALRIIHEGTREPAAEIGRALRERCTLSLPQGARLVNLFGREFPVEGSVAALRDEAGCVSGAVIALRDATLRSESRDIPSAGNDAGNLKLEDIIDVGAIQSLLDDYYKLTSMPLGVNDLEGRVLAGAGWQEICTRFHRAHPEACKNCIESDVRLSAGIPVGEFRLYKCKNNMWDIAAPITMEGRQIGSVFSGQFFLNDEPVDYEYFRAQAARYGFDEREYMAALDKAPRLSREAVETSMAFFMRLCGMFVDLSCSNIKLARLLAQRDQLTESLKRSDYLFNRAQEIAHVGAWELDLVKNHLSWSDEVYRIFGLQRQESGVSYQMFLDAVHPDDRAAVDEAYLSSLREVRNKYEVTHRIVRRDGETRWLHEKCEHARDSSGRVLASVGMVQDITDRRRAEEALKESEERFRLLVDGVKDFAIFMLDADGCVASWNDAAERIKGWRKEEILHRHFSAFYPPELRAAGHPQRELDIAAATGRYHEEGQRLRSDGSMFWADVTITALWTPDGRLRGFAKITRDITERKRAEQELRESEERFRTAFEQSAIGVVLISTDGRFTSVNDAFCAMLGYSREELVGRRFHEVTYPEDVSVSADALREIAESGAPTAALEKRYVRKNGTVVWAQLLSAALRDETGRPAGLITQIQDVTERKRAREALRESEERYRLLVEANPMGVVVAEVSGGRHGRILTANEAFLRMVGYAREEVESGRLRWTDLASPERLEGEEAAIAQASELGQSKPYESEYLRKDGSRIPAMVACAIVGERRDKAVAFVADLTERKRTEQALRQAQKLESIGVLAGGIAHDFNNLLTSILGNASLVETGSPEDRERLKAIVESTERAASLTRQLLAYAGKGQFQITEFDVARLVRSSADLIRVSIPRTVEVTLDAPRNLPAVRGDASQIHQVVMNLIINAAEAIPQGAAGEVSIRAAMEELDAGSAAAHASGLAPGRYISIQVRDNGCGMDEETQARIFDPFFTTKFTGRGLGLAAVQGILRSHGGAIEVESRAGAGSTFTVYLPASAAPAAAPAREGGETAGRETAATVLVVDDETAVRNFTKIALERLGHRVLLAANGREAVDVLQGVGGVDLVLLDIVMPVAGGAELFAEIQKSWPEASVLVASGYSREEAQRLGFPDDLPFIEKPYSAQKLGLAVENVLKARA